MQRTDDYLVLDNGTCRDHNLIAGVCNHNDGAFESRICAKIDVTGNGEVIEFENIWDASEALQILTNLLKLCTELNDWGSRKLSGRVHDEAAGFEGVHVALNEHEIRGGLDRKEASTRHIDTASIVEVGDGGADGCFELNDLLASNFLVVDNDVKLHFVGLHDALDGAKRDPDVVSVEDLELGDGLKLLDILGRDLGDLKKGHLSVIRDNGTTLDVSTCLVRELHAVLDVTIDNILEDIEIDGSAKIVNIGDEDVLFALGEEGVYQT